MNVIGPFPLYAKLTQSIHKFFMCVLFETRSKSSLCPCQLKNCEHNVKTYLIKIFVFVAQTVPHPMIYLSIHPWSHTISTSRYVGDTCQANEKGQGHVRPNSLGEQFFTVAINTPPLLYFFFTPLNLSPARASSTAATSSSPVRKSFTASTSSPSYSRRPWKSSLRRRRSCLPLPS